MADLQKLFAQLNVSNWDCPNQPALNFEQELINNVLKDLPFAIVYLDDIVIYRKSAKEQLDHLQ